MNACCCANCAQNNLKYWHKKTKVPLVQLVGGDLSPDTLKPASYLTSKAGIKEISE